MGLAPRQWVILVTFYTTYLLFGACVFYYLEHGAETLRRAELLKARNEINELLVSFTSPDDVQIQNVILDRVSRYCDKPVTNYKDDEFVDPYQWNFYHAVFFAFIVCSTLGYGNIAPTGTISRYFMVIYAGIGIPVNMILYTYLGEYFRQNFIEIYQKYKASRFARHPHVNVEYKPNRLTMIAHITICLLLPALIILVLIPSLIFTYFEGWDYSISVYYSFVTLSTIGFGDYVPTFQPKMKRKFGVYYVFYEIFVIIWFVFGLCYILMLIGFLARGMQSKKIKQIEKLLAEQIKVTHNRIWSGVSKDMGFLRRILNEIYIMRVRPVFVEPNDVQQSYRISRSQSCPELTLFNYKSPIARRKRCHSEVFFNGEAPDDYAEKIGLKTLQIQSRHSESNLMRIDKEKTFMQQQNSDDNTGDLLAKVVFALNTLHQTIEKSPGTTSVDGKNILSDENTFEDEILSIITAPTLLNDSKSFAQKKLRSRARSLYPQISKMPNATDTNSPQFTWAGNNNDIQNYINAQVKNGKKPTPPLIKEQCHVPINIDEAKDNDGFTATTMRRKSIFSVFHSVFRRRNTAAALTTESLIERIEPAKLSLAKKRSSAFEGKKMDVTRKSDYARRPSLLSDQSSTCSDQVLENTTIADLIRAIEDVHVKHMMDPKALDSRRISLAAQSSARRDSSTISSVALSSGKSNRFNSHRVSMAMSHNRMMSVPHRSEPHRFSVTPVRDSSPSRTLSLSPTVQRRLRKLSIASAATVMPQKNLSSSLEPSPLTTRRTQFKATISPLAMQPPTQSTESDVL